MKSWSQADLAVKVFLIFAFSIVGLLAFENLALSGIWFPDAQAPQNNIDQIKGIIEAELVELVLAILVIFSIATGLFSSWFSAQVDRKLEAAEAEITSRVVSMAHEEVLINGQRAYFAASAGFYHELAFQMFEEAEGDVLNVWFGSDDSDMQTKKELAKDRISKGIYFSERGLEYVKDYTPSDTDNSRHKRVSWHLRNTSVWLRGAEIIVSGPVGPKICYDDVLSDVDALYEFSVTTNGEQRPVWFEIHETLIFFLFALAGAFPGNGHKERAKNLLADLISGCPVRVGLERPPQNFIERVKKEYKKAGYLE